MKAMILAAGRGTRLGNLTKNRPKALVSFNGKPMLEQLLLRLKGQGFQHILINMHHFAEQVIDFVESHNGFGLDIQFSDEREQLLNTGGAIWFAQNFFRGEEPVLIHNVDICSDLDFRQLKQQFTATKALAGLVVRKRETSRYLLFDEQQKLTGWENRKTCEQKWVAEKQEVYTRMAFSGIYFVQPRFPQFLPFHGRFSIVDAWLKMAATQSIVALPDTGSTWFDLGTPESIRKAEAKIKPVTK